MLRLCMVRCPHMNTITMEDTLSALKLNRYVIEVPEDPRPRGKVGAEDDRNRLRLGLAYHKVLLYSSRNLASRTFHENQRCPSTIERRNGRNY